MDFKEILEAWEKKQTAGRQDMEELIPGYPPKNPKDADHRDETRPEASPRRPSPREMEPDAVLDLHGLTSREAEQALDSFILNARRRGLQQVLIIHGKGHHSQGEPVLQGVVRRYLEKCPHTGASGPAGREHGGRGATWVALRSG